MSGQGCRFWEICSGGRAVSEEAFTFWLKALEG